MQKLANEDLVKQELERESRMQANGAHRYIKRADKAMPSTKNISNNILANVLPEVALRMRQKIDKQLLPHKGRPPSWITYVQHIDSFVLAGMALNIMVDAVRKGNARNTVYVAIGERIELENIRIALEIEGGRKLVTEVENKIMKQSQKFWERRILLKSMIENQKFTTVTTWSPETHVDAAQELVNAVLEVSNIFDTWDRNVKGSTKSYFGLLPEASQLIADMEYREAWLSPIVEPMVVKPNKRTGFVTGGYLDETTASLVPLIKNASYSQRKTLEHQLSTGKKLKFMEALNAVQDTPLSINVYALQAVEWAWENDKEISKFPTKVKIDQEEMPKDFFNLPIEQQQFFKANQKKTEVKNREIDGHIVTMVQDLKVARDLCDFDCFWIVWQFCTRGRIYCASPFCYHREDSIKSLFLLANGKVLDDNGQYWLAIHIANVGDFDKVSKKSLDDRIQWVMDNQEMIYDVGRNFEKTFDIWKTADKPFQFVAACNAWANFKDFPETYECGIPVSLDGSSSGTQHYSAASLSSSDGQLVNLIDSEVPQDLYGAVADKVNVKLHKLIDGYIPVINRDEDGNVIKDKTLEIARSWLTPVDTYVNGVKENIYPGLTRAICKRSVMTYGYSSVKYGFAEQLMEDCISKIDDKVMRGKIERNPFGNDEPQQRKSANLLAGIIYESVQEVLTSVSEGMKFFSAISGLLAHEGKHVKFKNKMEFPMQQKYTHWDVKKVRIFLFDRVTQLKKRAQVSVRTNKSRKVDKKKSKQSVSANLIHSQDSCHLLATVLNMQDNYDINDFFLIHDAFATVPNDVEGMYSAVRESFVDLYDGYCLLTDVANKARKKLSDEGRAKLDQLEIPKKGALDLHAIMESKYCFC